MAESHDNDRPEDINYRKMTYVIILLRYDTRWYFNMRSKADVSQLNLPHGTNN